MTDRSTDIGSGGSAGMPRQMRAILDLLGVREEEASSVGTSEKVLHHLYRVLDTLDSKTSHVLRFISLILAAQVFLASTMIHAGNAPRWARIVLMLCPLLSLAGGMYSLAVFGVK